jgi:hypothetical protein
MSIDLLRSVVDSLEAGMSELDVVELAKAQGQAFGFTKWFHAPEVRFNGNISLFHRPSAKRVLGKSTLVEIDLAPATDDAFGDIGIGLCFDGEDPLVEASREACKAVCGFASRHKTVGELYVFAEAWANNHRTNLGNARSIGHICPLPRGILGASWPRAARFGILLRRHQVHFLNPRPIQGLYSLTPRIVQGKKGLCFEEMIFIDGDIRRIMGRNSDDEIGTY